MNLLAATYSVMDGAVLDSQRITVGGKFFRQGHRKWKAKGFSYGPFAPNSAGEALPELSQVRADFRQMRDMGANTLRVYFPPPIWFLDEAQCAGLNVFVDVPWEKHRCFFEDWSAQQAARDSVAAAARSLGNHPATFAFSVVNEIPPDVVRFYGHRRVEMFINELIDVAKQHAPQCLVTSVNFPSTEYLTALACDFCCFNVYLHDTTKLALYLDRLQHVSGLKPLILGEYGIDSLREGENTQADLISEHVRQIFRQGLAGSYVFSFTDEWFTGGHEILDWNFGVTRRDRSEKPVASELRNLWTSELPTNQAAAPKVSVVVCSYNGAATLRDCLSSLMRLNYPDYEVILVDDGSQDDTPAIAEDFPQIIYIRQPNRGLSVARNVGAGHASGEIVAYTDSDCVADEDWLLYLIQAMHDQKVEAIGGPNITPLRSGWISRCVAASPGNPSHVMLDDRLAEHVPGCNMAIRLDVLQGLDGFDPQFRQAGDDVDLCWRLIDAGMRIGYAPAAMVWHHRRSTVRAYLKQQEGYGRSEAMVHFKHPQKCGAFGRSSWRGIIYGDGAVGLPLMPERIYHGRFGMAPYQLLYCHNQYGLWSCIMSLEWHLLACGILVLATLFWPLVFLVVFMWTATLAVAIRSAWRAPLQAGGPWWCRPLIASLYILQPIVRGWHRQTNLLRAMRMPHTSTPLEDEIHHRVKRISATTQDLYWRSDEAKGREQLLEEMVGTATRVGWRGDFDDAWSDYDVKLIGDCWHDIRIRTATEELGWPNRFTRARCLVKPTIFANVLATITLVWAVAALLSCQLWAMLLALVLASTVIVMRGRSRRRCWRAVTILLITAGEAAELEAVDNKGNRTQRSNDAVPNDSMVENDLEQTVASRDT